MSFKNRFADILHEKQVVSDDVLNEALRVQMEEESANRRKLADILVSDFNIEHHSVFGLLARMYAFRTVTVNIDNLTDKHINQTKSLLNKIPEGLRKELLYNKILPYRETQKPRPTLIILAADPTDKLVEEIPKSSGFKKYEVVYCRLSTIEELIDIIAPQKNEFLDILKEVGDQIEELEESRSKSVIDEYALDDEINKSLLVNLFEGCLIEAVRKGASDIHIIPHGASTVDFYFRVDGKLTLWLRQDQTSPEAMAAVVKDRSNGVDRFERDTAQDGFAQRNIDGNLIRFRVSIVAITSSEYERRLESIVIRVIDDRNVITNLRQLGFQEKAEGDFLKSISKSKGVVLVTGPTGSGKSTTLMAALYQIIDPSINILTCEDPVEYVIRGARQLKIGAKMSFDQAIRAILRHDPDVVMVGEIRDKTTAETAVKLANTGHLTFSTLHTNDAPSAVSRLYKMGVEPFLLAYAINIIVAQRLVRKLCKTCREVIKPERYKSGLELGLSLEEMKSGNIYQPGPGCQNCHNGYKGRVNICEALYFTPEVRKAVAESGEEVDEARIREVAEGQGMLSLMESGRDRIRNGLTSVEEIIYATSED